MTPRSFQVCDISKQNRSYKNLDFRETHQQRFSSWAAAAAARQAAAAERATANPQYLGTNASKVCMHER
jgi:hypothetical protein